MREEPPARHSPPSPAAGEPGAQGHRQGRDFGVDGRHGFDRPVLFRHIAHPLLSFKHAARARPIATGARTAGVRPDHARGNSAKPRGRDPPELKKRLPPRDRSRPRCRGISREQSPATTSRSTAHAGTCPTAPYHRARAGAGRERLPTPKQWREAARRLGAQAPASSRELAERARIRRPGTRRAILVRGRFWYARDRQDRRFRDRCAAESATPGTASPCGTRPEGLRRPETRTTGCRGVRDGVARLSRRRNGRQFRRARSGQAISNAGGPGTPSGQGGWFR